MKKNGCGSDNLEDIDILEQHITKRNIKVLKVLLKDKTTGNYIKWATENYEEFGLGYKANDEILPDLVTGRMTKLIQPRVLKTQDEQIKRTRDKAEVFTPTWIVNQQNNLVDEAWFGRCVVFNSSDGKSINPIKKKIVFPEGKDWKKYVDLKRLEVSCGEAPYLVNRYDTVTGKFIEVNERVGLLDRKLRVINENVDEFSEWNKWVVRAFQSVYGYELQGDNVLLARENLLYTYIDYMLYKFNIEPDLKQQMKIANIIAWNIWQMDGITMTAPYSQEKETYHQMSIFEWCTSDDVCKEARIRFEALPCRIFDWRSNESLEFRTMMKGAD